MRIIYLYLIKVNFSANTVIIKNRPTFGRARARIQRGPVYNFIHRSNSVYICIDSNFIGNM